MIANDVDILNAMFWRSEFTVHYGVAENLYDNAVPIGASIPNSLTAIPPTFVSRPPAK
ncbi:MAG: DUF3225 domain-containing protein [Rhodospirillales bacterium]|nr:DUF3225 domain-containing protein [Rhodospirillales bacterium]